MTSFDTLDCYCSCATVLVLLFLYYYCCSSVTLVEYRCVPKIASPEARKEIHIKHNDREFLVNLKSSRRRREQKLHTKRNDDQIGCRIASDHLRQRKHSKKQVENKIEEVIKDSFSFDFPIYPLFCSHVG